MKELKKRYWRDVSAVAIALSRCGLYYDMRRKILELCAVSFKEYEDEVAFREKTKKALQLIKLRGCKDANDLRLYHMIQSGNTPLPDNWMAKEKQISPIRVNFYWGSPFGYHWSHFFTLAGI